MEKSGRGSGHRTYVCTYAGDTLPKLYIHSMLAHSSLFFEILQFESLMVAELLPVAAGQLVVE